MYFHLSAAVSYFKFQIIPHFFQHNQIHYKNMRLAWFCLCFPNLSNFEPSSSSAAAVPITSWHYQLTQKGNSSIGRSSCIMDYRGATSSSWRREAQKRHFQKQHQLLGKQPPADRWAGHEATECWFRSIGGEHGFQQIKSPSNSRLLLNKKTKKTETKPNKSLPYQQPVISNHHQCYHQLT